MSGGGSKGTSQQTSVVQLPDWVNKASQQNYEFATKVAGQPYQPYAGERVASLPNETLDAMDYLRSNVGAYQGNYDAASAAQGGLLGYTPTRVDPYTVTAGKTAGSDLTPYLNPYTAEVEDKAMGNLERSRQLSTGANADAAIKAKAFGGTRHGVVDAVTNSETARAAGDLSANLRKQGFDTAQGLLTGDLNRELSAALANQGVFMDAQKSNQSADLAGAGVRQNAASGIVDTAQKGSANILQDYFGLKDVGNTLEQKQQQYLDEMYGNFSEAKDYPKEQLNILLSALGMSPYGKMESGTKTESKSSSPDLATAGLGGLSLLKGMGAFAPLMAASDDTLKTDIQDLGTIPGKKGVKAFAFRYKGDPKTYPKTIGVMASDVKKKIPGAVKKFGQKRVVDYSKVLRQA